ncbi:hypothetical protein [Variovorax sp. UMC13]|uniref:hypothetical protein n=1 Tax=Variovorax sp. UMC13 TaxID=1862326 RepID=UPI001603599F|nr:hypothetical protein [Variovorax sp. UMC13]
MNQVAISFGSDNPLVVAQWQAMLRGLRGLSAYEVAVKNGFVGTEAEWLESLHGGGSGGSGPPGLSAYQVAVKNGFVGTEAQWLASLEGRPGVDSTVPGPPGLSAYEIAVKNGFVGSESAWEASLIGPPGQDAPGGGERSRADRVLQTLISKAAFTMGNNRFRTSALRDAPTMTPVGAIEGAMTRGYSAITDGPKPWQILGGAPVVDGFGIRGINTSFKPGVQLSMLYWVDQIIDGNACNVILEKGTPYRLLVEEDSVMKYVPDSSITLATGTGQQVYRIAFPNPTGPRARRRFWIESPFFQPVEATATAGRFGGTYVAKQDQIVRPAKQLLRAVHIGDSNIQGVNGPHGGSHSCVMAAHLGIEDHWISAIHTTGELQANIGGFVWHERRNDWRDPKPDILFFNLSWVDREVVKNGEFTLSAAVTRIMGEFNAARFEFPQMPVIVLGLLWSAEQYALNPDIQAFNDAFQAAIAAKADPLLIFVDGARYPETPITGLGKQGSETGEGNADVYLGSDGHYTQAGDEWVGITGAQSVLEKLTEAFYGGISPPPSVAIRPSSLTITGAPGSSAAGNLGTVSNGTATGIVSVTPAVPGVTFSMSGQTLVAAGTFPSTAGTYQTAIVVGTSAGNVTFNLVANVVAAGPSINPASADVAARANEAIDVLLTTVSGGTLTGITGALPAGLSYTRSGQEVRLTGTPSAPAAQSARAAVIATSTGNITLNWSLTIGAAAADERTVAELRFEGTQGSQVITNSATGPGALTFSIPSGATWISTGLGVKEGLRALQRRDPGFSDPGVVSTETLTLNGKFFWGGWAVHDGNGCVFALGDYNGASYLDIEINGEKLEVYRQQSAVGGDQLIEASAAGWPANTPGYLSLSRDDANTLALGLNGIALATRTNVTDVFTGRFGILNQPENPGYGLQGGWADLCKVIVGGSGPAFPFMPPTT